MSVELKPIRHPSPLICKGLRLTAQVLLLCVIVPCTFIVEPSASEEPSVEAAAVPSQSGTASATKVPIIEIDSLCECAKKATMGCLNPKELAAVCGEGAKACAHPKECKFFVRETSYMCKKVLPERKVGMDNGVELTLDELYAASGFYESVSENMDVYDAEFLSYLNEATTVSSSFSDSFFVSAIDEEAKKAQEEAVGEAKAAEIDEYCIYIHEMHHLCEYSAKPCEDERPALNKQLICLNKYFKAKCVDPQPTDLSLDARNSLCKSLCVYASERAAHLNFAESFCLSNRDENSCCRAVQACKNIANIPAECKAEWLDKDRIDKKCEAKTSDIVHSCKYYSTNPKLVNIDCR